MAESYDVVVVGSGFGGAVTAWRLAGAGLRVVLLERGQRWPPGSFARSLTDVERIFWDEERAPHWRGPYQIRFHSGLATVVASGLGGGSLIYANNLVRPDPEVFASWPIPYGRAFLDRYYDRIEALLKPTPVPPEIALPKRDAFRRAAARLGHACFDTAQPVNWPRGVPGERDCTLCAECEFGCNRGAKQSLDLNLIHDAELAGVEIRTGASVQRVTSTPGPDGTTAYAVHVRDLARGDPYTLAARRVVLAAGTLGTNEILLRSRAGPDGLHHLSSRLGTGFSANGDFLGTLQDASAPLDPGKGPDVTTVMKLSLEGRAVTVAAPSFSSGAMRTLATYGQMGEHHANWLTNHLWPHLGAALHAACASGLVQRPLPVALPGSGPPTHMTPLFALAQDNAGGRVVLDGDTLDVQWNYATENRALLQGIEAVLTRLAEAYGGHYAPLPTYAVFEKILSVHPLGGCALARDPRDGVVDTNGEVFGHPGLFVADGALLPGALGFHPALTIAALALRCADGIAARPH